MSLGETLRRNTLWVLSGEIGARGAQFVFGILLARLLLPEDFGLLVTVQLLTGALGFIAAHGMNDALVRARIVQPGDIRTIFTIQLAICAAIVTGLNLAAHQFAALFDDERLESLLRLASLTFLFRPLIGVPTALLQRESRFRELSLLILLEVALAGIASVVYALLGFGAWGLLLGGHTGTLVRTFTAMRLAGWTPTFGMNPASARALGSYGMKISINEIIQYLRIQTANAVISHELGASKVGLYNKADSLGEMPFDIIGGSAYQTLFRALAGIQDRIDQSRRLFVQVIVTASLYALPLYLMLIWVGEALIVTLYGSEWAGAGVALQILALAGPFRLVSALSRAVVAAHNRLGREIFIQLETWGLVIIGVLVGLRWELAGVAIALLPAFVHNAVRTYGLADRILGCGWLPLWRALRPVLGLNALMMASLAGVHWGLASSGLAEPGPLYLLALVASGGLVYTAVLLVRPPPGLEAESGRWRRALRSAVAAAGAAARASLDAARKPPTTPRVGRDESELR